MRLATHLIALLLLFSITSCDFSGCNGIRQENELTYQKYLDLRKQRYKEWQGQALEWEKSNQAEQSRKNSELQRCLEDPLSYYKKSKFKGAVDWWGGFYSHKGKFGIQSTCDSLQGIGSLLGAKPIDDSLSHPPAVAQYVLSMTIIKNNPKCFSATQVAEAEQELIRLNSNP
jgi:hypothetical protein